MADDPRSVSEALAGAEAPETTTENGKGAVPENERPNVSAVSFGDDLGDEDVPRALDGTPLDLDNYPDATPEYPLGFLPSGEPRKRRKRGTASSGAPRVAGDSRPRGANAVRQKAAAGASILYGGIGVLLSGTGLAPAAGFSMQGLADEAGMPIAEWAEKRSPRFYQFLASISDATGIGKYVGAPVSAEAYVRIREARPALGPVVEFAHGPEFMTPINELAAGYDAMRESQDGAADGPFPPVE